MIHIFWYCPCGLELVLAFDEYEYKFKCPKCGLKVFRRFNTIGKEDYEILFEESKGTNNKEVKV